VLFDGAAGAHRAADILEQFATGSEDLSIKWDGRLAAYYGRDQDGVFGLSTIGGWRQNDPSKTPSQIKNRVLTSGNREDWRSAMGEALARAFPVLEHSVPKNFRGFVKGDVLYAAPMTPKLSTNQSVRFTPNQVTYTVDTSSEIGQRVAQTEIGVALHAYYTVWGDDSSGVPIQPDMVESLNTGDVLALGQTYVVNNPVVDTAAIDRIRTEANKHGAAIDSIVAGRKGLADMYNILYNYVNQSVKARQVDMIGSDHLLVWLPTSKVSKNKQVKINTIVEQERQAFDALFGLMRTIMDAKNDIIAQLDAADHDIKATTHGQPGGEGYVSVKTNTKLVPRHQWIPK
jgi:hypothetical protein